MTQDAIFSILRKGVLSPSDLVFKNGVARIVKSQKARQKKHAGGESGGSLILS